MSSEFLPGRDYISQVLRQIHYQDLIMSSLNLQSCLVFAVCAQLFALGLAGVMYPYGIAQGDRSMPVFTEKITIAPSIRVFGADIHYLWVSI